MQFIIGILHVQVMAARQNRLLMSRVSSVDGPNPNGSIHASCERRTQNSEGARLTILLITISYSFFTAHASKQLNTHHQRYVICKPTS